MAAKDVADPAAAIEQMIAAAPDERGALMAQARAAILAVDPDIVETWKWMGSPVWELDGILVVGNIFKAKIKLGFMYGASLADPQGVFNGELGGNQRRSYELAPGDELNVPALQDLVREAIAFNRAKRAAAKK